MRIFKNRKAVHNYYIVQEMEAGIILKGTEIKSIRAGKVNFKDSYGKIENGEVWLYNLHIGIYVQGSIYNHDPDRKRKLLLNKKEIKKIYHKIEEKGMAIIPTELYINEAGLVKLTLAVAKGKRKYDKRESIKKKEALREDQRKLKLN